MVARPEVLIAEAGSGEQLGSGKLLVATADIYLSEYTLEPGTEPGDPGTVLSAPRGAIHAFPVAIGGGARFLNLHTPGGFETYMRELIAMRERGEKPDAEFMAAHDMHLV